MAVPYAGNVRTKSRQQAQDERRWGQDRFEGAQDSDTPPVKIGTNELALATNVVCYPDRIEGGYGRALASDERLPGSGTRHCIQQHAVTGRWLLHRGDKLWLSAGRRQREWSEVTTIGPNGSLDATGSFYTDYVISGPAAGFLRALVIFGWDGVGAMTIEIAPGPSLDTAAIQLILDGVQVSFAEPIDISSQPVVGAVISEQFGSGISAVVDINGYLFGDTYSGDVTPGSTAPVTFTLHSLTLENTDNYELWWSVVVSSSVATIALYKDAARTQPVAGGETSNDSTAPEISPASGSGIFGYASQIPVSSLVDGVYIGSQIVFVPAVSSIDAASTICTWRDSYFFLFVRGSNPKNIVVDQKLLKFWEDSTSYGYGSVPFASLGFGDYEYRYLYTYSRIVDATTGEPSTGNRISAVLAFEGPSTAVDAGAIDYSTQSSSDPVSNSNPINLTLGTGVPSPGSNPISSGLNAAAYITHFSIYRTLDVGVNGAVNNPEIYIWVADIPIYSASYADTTTDATLQNRFSGGALSGENFALRSRFYREMDRGLGAIRPDFMATATPQGTRITYCDVGVNPRFIGYYFPGTQYNLTQDPISDIVSTKDLLVYLCPYSTYTSITAIAVDTGIQGISYIPVIQNFERSSQNVGVKYGQRTFPVTDSSFVSLCSDGTIRVYSGTFWGEALDGTRVHKLIELAQVGAVMLYFRDVLYMWYTTDADATVTDKCLRYGSGGQSGNGWTPVEREHWVWPPVGGGMAAVWEQDDASFRMIAIDDVEDVAFAIEDLPPLRQYEDDLLTEGFSIRGAGENSLANLVLPGWAGTLLYGIIRPSGGGVVVQFFVSEADRTNDVDAIGTTGVLTEPVIGAYITTDTDPGTVDVLDISPVEFIVFPTVLVAGKSQIASPIRIRALAATQQQFFCFAQESYTFFRAVYGMPMPVVAAQWYADDILIPQSIQSSIPPNGDIQSYAQVKGRTIQFEIEPQSSGWQLTGINVKYQTQDMRSVNGPWNSVEQSLQRELAQGLFSWVLGVTGILNRADWLYPKFSGAVPVLIPGPFDRIGGQSFAEASTLEIDRQLTTYSLMFWVKDPVIGIDAAPIALLDVNGDPVAYLMFPDSTHISIGSFDYEVIETSEWVCYCVTRSEDGFKTYRNGALIGDNTLSPGTDVTIKSIRIGPQSMYDVRVYSSILSPDAVAYYYNHLNQTPP